MSVEKPVQRRLAAVLAADVVGYSRMMHADEVGTRERFNAHFTELLLPAIASHGGRLVKTIGDGLLAEFPSAVEAVRCADGVQNSMIDRNAGKPPEQQFELRIGVNVGDVIVEGEDIHGDGVNIAARLEALADPGSVYISAETVAHVRGKLDVTFKSLGDHNLRNIVSPVEVFRISPHDLGDAEDQNAPFGQLSIKRDKPSIAVLPFRNLSADLDQNYFSEGVAEDLIDALGRFGWLFVIARSTSFGYSGSNREPRAIAADLGVSYIVDGSVRKSGTRIRISVELVDGESGLRIWSERYDRDLTDIFLVQDEITKAIAGALEPELVRSEQDRARLKRPENLHAWDLCQKAMWHSWRRSKEDLDEALHLFTKAREIDPTFSRAFSGSAEALCFQFIRGFVSDSAGGLKEANDLATHGVRLDERDSYARYSLGRTLMFMRRHRAAQPELETAIEINPNFALAFFALGNTLITSGRAAEGIPLLHEAMKLSPRDPQIGQMMTRVAEAHLFLDQNEEALDWARRSLRQPNIQPTRWVVLLSILGHLGREDEVGPARDALRDLDPGYGIEFVRERFPIIHEPYMKRLISGLVSAGL